jgi:S-adenosylmethionine hydrolase
VPEEVPLTGAGARRPLVSLLTDFGHTEPFVGLVKARILAACPEASIVDLTHDLPAFGVEVAAFWIERASAHFPPGSLHVCVVDPGVGTARRILLVEQGAQLFLAPDNGLLTGVAGRAGSVVRAISPTYLEAAGLGRPSATFHGRDLFAPLAGWLAAGQATPVDVGEPIADWQTLAIPVPAPARDGARIVGRILFADRFGNLFSNIAALSIANREEWQVLVAGHAVPWVRTYGDAAAGTLVALENSFGVVEIACVGGSAAETVQQGPGAELELRRRIGPDDPGY